MSNVIKALREKARKEDPRLFSLYKQIDFVSKEIDLPPISLSMIKMKADSRFRIHDRSTESARFYNIGINERLYLLNNDRRIEAAFRGILIHVWQLEVGQRQAETKVWKKIAKSIKAIPSRELKRPASKHSILTYICPQGCQQFRSIDSVVVICYHCGQKMNAISQTAYRKIKENRKEKVKELRDRIKKRREKEDES